MAHWTRLARINSLPAHWFTDIRDALRRWLKPVRVLSERAMLQRLQRWRFAKPSLEGLEARIVPAVATGVEGAMAQVAQMRTLEAAVTHTSFAPLLLDLPAATETAAWLPTAKHASRSDAVFMHQPIHHSVAAEAAQSAFTGKAATANAPAAAPADSPSMSGTEGSVFGGLLASFNNATGNANDQYSATIDWGNGQSSPGIVSVTASTIQVSGYLTYKEEGQYAINVSIAGPGGPQSTTINATVADAPLTADNMSGSFWTTVGQDWGGSLISFLDQNIFSSGDDYTVAIN